MCTLSHHLLDPAHTLTQIARHQAARWHVKLLDDYEGFCKGHANDPTPDDSNGTLEFVQGDLRYPGKVHALRPSTLPRASCRGESGVGGGGALCHRVGRDACGAVVQWEDAFAGVDSIMHLQAWNPYPEVRADDARPPLLPIPHRSTYTWCLSARHSVCFFVLCFWTPHSCTMQTLAHLAACRPPGKTADSAWT